MAAIFIRYIPEDERVVAPLHNYVKERLGRQHTICLSAGTSPHGGRKDAQDREQEELRTATVILLMCSQQSVQRPWVHAIADKARRAHKVATYLCFWDLSPGEVSQRCSGAYAFNLRNQLELLIASLAYDLHISLPVSFLGEDRLSFRRLRAVLESQQPAIEKEKREPTYGRSTPCFLEADMRQKPANCLIKSDANSW